MRVLFLAAAAGILLAAGAAAAQTASPRPDVKEIGDWSVRCFPIRSPSPCDMYQEMDDKASRRRVLSVSIAYVPKMDRHALQITVPLGVAIQPGVVIQTDSFTSAKLHYRQCDRSGCFVQMLLDNNSVQAMAKSGPEAKIKIVADGGKPFDLRFSLNGFSAAHDAMIASARAKAADAPATLTASATVPK